MKKKIFVKGPVLSQSGYGEQARFALRALRSREDIFDIYIQPINWGQTGWVWESNEFRDWMDDRILRTQFELQQKTLQPDISLQITIPNEFEKLCPINIGYTAGIETDRVSPQWLQKGNDMSKILVVSNHAKNTYINTLATARNQQTGQELPYKLETPVEVVWENTVLAPEPEEIPGFNPRHDFNFLCVSQMGPRKNLENTIRWFVEECIDEENKCLIIKTNIKSNSRIDKEYAEETLKSILSHYPDRKCSVSLLHGDLTEGQMRALYEHPRIKAMINISHGEGFGLPLFEAARVGLPIISIDWSGQTDFLEDKFLKVKHEIKPVQPQAVWNGVIQADSQWAYANQGSFKMALRMMDKKWDVFSKQAAELSKSICNKFSDEVLYKLFCNSILGQNTKKAVEVDGISFCIPTNGAKLDKLKLTLSAIKRETGTFPREVIIAGDISGLEPEEGLTLIDKALLAHSGNVAALRNATADVAKYDTIVWLDDDIVLGEGWLEGTLEFSKQNGWDVLGNRLLNPDGSRHWDRATLRPHRMVDYDHPSYDKNLYQTSGFIMCRKKVFETVRWDETCLVKADHNGGIPEDVKFSMDLLERGFELSFNESATVWHNDDRYTQIDVSTLLKSVIEETNPNIMFPPTSKRFERLMEFYNG